MRVLLDECVPRALLKLAVVVIEAPSNDVSVLRPLMAAVREAISKAQPGVVTRVRR
jgi:hypothetical protein